jgi:uncharacterized repeat protein (TIGR01451 family)
MEAGASATITIVVDVDSSQRDTFLNLARVSASNPDPNPDNNQVTEDTTAEGIADLSIEKRAYPPVAVPGETLVYEIIATNLGPSDVNGVTVNDSLPAGFTVNSFSTSQGICQLNGTLLTCDLGVVAAGESVVITVIGTVSGTATGDLVNAASVLGCVGCAEDPNPDNNTTTIVTPVTLDADLELAKWATATAIAGGRITYTLQVFNHGPSTATSLVITDTLPEGVTPVLASLPVDCGLYAGNEVRCQVASLTAGSMASFTFEVDVNNDVEPGTSLENVAVVGSSVPDSRPLNNTAVADTSIVSLADLAITKAGPATVTAGGEVVYQISVTNYGPSTAQSVDVKDLLPPGVSYVAGSASQGLCVSGICQLGDMGVDETVTIVITGAVGSDVPPGTITNMAQVFSDSTDPDDTNNQATAESTVETSADLSISKVDLKDPVAPTEGFLYQIMVINDGPSDAQDVVVTDTLDANVSFQTASPGCTHDGSPAGGTVTCDAGTLPAGQGTSYLVAVTASNVEPGTILTNQAGVSSSTGDPNVANNQDSEETTVELQVGPSTDVGITKSAAPAAVLAGEQVTYTLTVYNNGPQIATEVTVFDLVPFGTTLISAAVDNPDYADEYCSAGGSCYLGTVYVGTVATVQLVLQVDPDYLGSSLSNTARVSADQPDNNPSNNIASAQVAVQQSADLSLVKTDMVESVIAGDVILYQITVVNNGPSDAQSVRVVDAVPANTVFVGGSPVCSELGGIITCELGDIPAGESAAVSIQVRLDQTVPDGTIIVNSATVSSDTPDPNTENNTDGEETTVFQSPYNPTDLSITKQDMLDPVLASGILTYTLEVANNGPAPATGVMVLDALPVGVSFVSATTSKPFGLCSGGVVCFLGQMAVGETAVITIVVTVDAGQMAPILNAALVTSSNPDIYPDNNQDSEITQVTAEADLSIEKSASPTPATPGASLRYEILVRNQGPSDAQEVQMTDVLPAALQSVTWSTPQGSCSTLPGNVLRCTLGTIPAGGQVIVTVVGMVAGTATDDLINNAWVESLTPDPYEPNNSTTTTTSVSRRADLEIRKGATPTVQAGEMITYTLELFNHGPSEAVDARITDTVPSGVTVVLPLPSGCGLNSGSTVICGPLDLAAGTSQTYTFSVISADDLQPGTSLENIASVGSLTPDPVSINDTDTADTSITGLSDLQISKSGPITVTAGEEITYTIVVTNAGPAMAHLVDIKDTLPQGITLVSATIQRSGSGTAACSGAICQLSSMAVGEVATVTVIGTVDSTLEGTITNEATVFSNAPDPDPTNNTDSVSAEVLTSMPTVAVEKRVVSVDLDSSYPNYVTFEIEITNVGPTTIATLPMFDNYDPYYLGFVSATPSPTIVEAETGILTWHDLTGSAPYGFGSDLEPGESVVVTVVFVVEHNITTFTTNHVLIDYALDVQDRMADPVEDTAQVVGVPTSVQLAGFQASMAGDVVSIEWQTESETDVWGFSIYRSQTPAFSEAEAIHTELSQGSNMEGDYYYFDDAEVDSGHVYYYWLAYQLTNDPDNTLYVLAGAERVITARYHIHLPMITR